MAALKIGSLDPYARSPENVRRRGIKIERRADCEVALSDCDSMAVYAEARVLGALHPPVGIPTDKLPARTAQQQEALECARQMLAWFRKNEKTGPLAQYHRQLQGAVSPPTKVGSGLDATRP